MKQGWRLTALFLLVVLLGGCASVGSPSDPAVPQENGENRIHETIREAEDSQTSVAPQTDSEGSPSLPLAPEKPFDTDPVLLTDLPEVSPEISGLTAFPEDSLFEINPSNDLPEPHIPQIAWIPPHPENEWFSLPRELPELPVFESSTSAELEGGIEVEPPEAESEAVVPVVSDNTETMNSEPENEPFLSATSRPLDESEVVLEPQEILSVSLEQIEETTAVGEAWRITFERPIWYLLSIRPEEGSNMPPEDGLRFESRDHLSDGSLQFLFSCRNTGVYLIHFSGQDLREGRFFTQVCRLEVLEESAEATSDVNTPDVNTPDVNTPDVNTPDVNTPDVNTPDVNTPAEGTPDEYTHEEEPSGSTWVNETESEVEVEEESFVFPESPEAWFQRYPRWIELETVLKREFPSEPRRVLETAEELLYSGYYPRSRDALCLLIAGFYELESPLRNPGEAIRYYRLLTQTFPASRYWEEADERRRYLERHFFLIR